MKLPIGIDDFKELIDGKFLFADKSLFIKDIINEGSKIILITRPRRFGKTLNLSMLDYFLGQNHHKEENKHLFEGLNISKDAEFCKKHQQQYPVIFLTFKDIKASSYPKAYNDITGVIKELYANHRYLLEGDLLYEDEKKEFTSLLNKEADESTIKKALKQLCEYISRKFNQSPILLIDEYDTPMQEAYLKEYYDPMVELMRGILGQTLKGNKYLAKAVLTGITRVAQASLFSGLNNIAVYTSLKEKYGQYFGFTEEEVLYFLNIAGQSVSLESIKESYNGYQIGKYTLYNPWSIINCLADGGKLLSYWLNTASNELLQKLLTQSNLIVKEELGQLVQGKTIEQPISENLVFPELEKQAPALWSLLLYTGYLKVLSSELKSGLIIAKLAIPNKEVHWIYENIISRWFNAGNDLELYDSFAQSLSNGDMETFKHRLSQYLIQSGSYFEFNSNTPEQVFLVFFLGLVAKLNSRYIISSNQESGLGRLDVVFIPKESGANGIVVEFKTSDKLDHLLAKAQEALEQIKEKAYKEILKKHEVKSVLAVGIAFFGKKVELVHEYI